MPKTKFQSFIFTLIMVFCMVFCMTVYTISLNEGGLSYKILAQAVTEMWLEYVIVFLLIFFVITKLAMRLAFRVVDPAKDKPIMVTIAIQSFTVMLIVPAITLIAAFLHGGFTADWFTRWISTAAKCFPCAYCLQIFFIGPFVRAIFRLIFQPEKLPEEA